MPHTTPDYYHLEISEIKAETRLAFLCIVTRIGDEDLDEWDEWIPKSLITDSEDYTSGDKDCTMLVAGWWIEQHEDFKTLFNF